MVYLKIGINKIEYPIVHIYIYGKLIQHCDGLRIIDKAYLLEWIGRIVRIPSNDKRLLIKEMEKIGLITKVNEVTYELNKIKLKEKPTDFYGNPLW